MKRTLIVATTSYAGMGPYVSQIVNAFLPAEDVFYFFHEYEDEFFRKNIKPELHSKSVFHKEANSSFNKLYTLVTNRNRYDKMILLLCEEKGIELVHYINLCPTVKMQAKFAKMGVTVLSTVHELIPHEADKIWYKQFKQDVIYRRQAENLKQARYLVTNSTEQYKELKKLYPQAQIAYHAFPSLVTDTIIQGKEMPPEMTKTTKPYILFFGRIEKYKGVELLYDAFCKDNALHENYNLVIAGYGQLKIEKVEGERTLIVINRYIKDTEVAYLYKNAKCVVYPYISATQSGVLSLAFYFNVPVVASDVPFFQEVIGHSKTGYLFKAGDINNLCDKLRRILQVDCSAMKQQQAKYYKEVYDGDAIKEKLLEIYSMIG